MCLFYVSFSTSLSIYLYEDEYPCERYWCMPSPYSSNFPLTHLHIYALGILLLRCLQSRGALKWIHTGMDVNKRECGVTSGCPKPRAAACRKSGLLWDFFIPFSPTGISRWEWTRQGMVKKLCGQSNWANAERKVIATLLGDSSDYFLLGIRYPGLSQTALELPSLPLPLHAEHGWANKQKTSKKSFGERVSKRLQGVLEKNNWLSFGWKKRPKSDFFPPSILWSAPTTQVSSREGRRVDCKLYLLRDPGSASPLCYGLLVWPWASHSPPLGFASPCCKTRPIIQASLAGGMCGEDVFFRHCGILEQLLSEGPVSISCALSFTWSKMPKCPQRISQW